MHVTCRHDPAGNNGLQYVIKVILHLLDPLVPEFSACFVGKLILVFIKKVSTLTVVCMCRIS